ncbi:hypothetical protein [Lacinutrix mariniflava]|uniref:hypothetical protein n=1 Tax=Lacinutrix mariniflava TaxID=342955 RepID=UPI0006E410DA|nr:hypothetical protein [Lacinutrix mariniflava]
MIEILAISYFIKQIKKIALEKGIKATKWIIATVASWFILEIIVFILAFTVFNVNEDDILIIIVPALLAAATSAFLILEMLKKQPKVESQEIQS